MSAREFIALGTQSQVPSRHRNHNGYFLRFDNYGLLFDPGEGSQRQMIFSGVSAPDITHIFITHFHGDHCLGFAGICQRLSLDRVDRPVKVFFPASGEEYFHNLHNASLYHHYTEIVPQPIKESGLIFEDKKIRIYAEALDHGPETYGFRMEEKDSITMNKEALKKAGISGLEVRTLIEDAYLIKDEKRYELDDYSILKKGQKFAFVMDTRMCDGAYKLAKDVDLLVCESTYLESENREAHAHGHLTAKQAATIAKYSGAKSLILTHFSQRYTENAPFVEEAEQVFKPAIAAEDTKHYPFPQRKRYT